MTMFRKFGVLVAVTLILSTILPLVTPIYAQTPQTPEDWFKAAAKPYAGVTIRGISESTPPGKYMHDVIVPKFTEATGIKVEFELTSWDEMYDKGTRDMEAGTGIYDFWYIEQDFIYASLANKWLTDLTQMMTDKPELTFPGLDLADFTAFADYFKDVKTGHLYGLPFEAFLKSYMYRKDLFNDPQIQAAFKAKYHWDLRPAVNYDEYTQIAEFFTDWGKDKELWGTTITAATHAAMNAELVETLMPSFGVYNWGVNLDKMQASVANGGTLNSPRAKECLTFFLKMLDYAPPEARSSTWDEVAASMAAGRAAQGFIYFENLPWIQTDPTRSKVTDKVGIAILPMKPGVLNDAVLGKGYVGYYDGGALGVPHSSKNKEAAWLFLQWMGRKDFQPEWAVKTARVVRNSTTDSPLLAELNGKLDNYFTFLRIAGPLYRGNPPLVNLRQLIDVYMGYFAKAIAGELTVDQCLDQLAAQVDKTMVDLGYAKK